jgi:hypothetical protein
MKTKPTGTRIRTLIGIAIRITPTIPTIATAAAITEIREISI